MWHNLLLWNDLSPTDFVAVFLRLDGAGGNLEQAVVENVSIDVCVPGVPEARGVREVGEEMRDLFLWY